MAKTVEQIERDLATLNQLLERLAQELQSTYQKYLVTLGRGLRQQLILACYHLCTQGYPNEFLALSFSQRQELQQALQALARQTQAQLELWLDPSAVQSTLPEPSAVLESAPLDEQLDKQLDEQLDERLDERLDKQLDIEDSGDARLPSDADLDIGAKNESVGMEIGDRSFDEVAILEIITAPELTGVAPNTDSGTDGGADDGTAPDSDLDGDPDIAQPPAKRPPAPKRPAFDPLSIMQSTTPKELAQWHDGMEHRIGEVLLEVSHHANRLLQQARLLPNQLPEPILEVAAKAGIAMETTAGPPNLLNLVLETESKDGESSTTHVMAIRLRLSEMEFSDPELANGRSQIRGLLGRLSQLRRDYHKRQKERAIAQAEAAWRSSWYEDRS